MKIVAARIRSAGLACVVAARGQQIFYVGTAVVFAAGALWRWELQVWILHQSVDESGDGAAGLGQGGVFVVALAAVREMLDQCIDQHVGRARVEGKHLRRLGGCWQER